MLLASVRTMPGIHQRIPATVPSSLRMVKVSVSFRTWSASAWVVVAQSLPTIGKLTSTTGPRPRSFSIAAAGLRKYSWLVKSGCSVMSASCLDRCAVDSDISRSGQIDVIDPIQTLSPVSHCWPEPG
jgi:hypothetical protein